MIDYRPGIFKALYLQLFIGLLGLMLTASCKKNNVEDTAAVTRYVQTADSLSVMGKKEESYEYVKVLKAEHGALNPIATLFYYQAAEHSRSNVPLMNRYADSALAIFKDQQLRKDYPSLYFRALVMRGIAYICDKKYNLALQYYYNAKKLPVSDCEMGDLLSTIAGTFYNQKNFAMAASNWTQAYNLFDHCSDTNLPQKTFFLKQGVLDNAGVAYQRMGKLDSAFYYFKLDLELIDDVERSKALADQYISGARIVVYDNFGGLYLSKGDLVQAEKYLKASIGIKQQDVDGIRIPPNIKLAALYLKRGDLKSAGTVLDKARLLLDTYPDNQGPNLEWHRLYAQWLLKSNRLPAAFHMQEKYVALKNYQDSTSISLLGLNINKEFETIRQEQTFSELKGRDEMKQFYLRGLSVAGGLLLVIIILIYGNLKESRRNQKDTLLRNDELQRTMAELERANKNYIRIMRVMAHDLRNPLGGMTGIATMLLAEEGFSEENRQMLQLIESTGMHTMEMINELLKSGLSSDEQEQMECHHIDLSALLYDSVELLQFKAREKDQQITLESQDAPLTANVNYEKMWRVFNNLIVNALKFSHDNSVIHVGIKPQHKKILITVADNGVGIPEQDKEFIFEMFTSAKKPGTNGEQPFGLGLSISKRIIEMHHGKIWFESKEGTGTTFYVELPMV